MNRTTRGLLPFATSATWMRSTALPTQRGSFYMSLMYQWEHSQWAAAEQKQARSLHQRDFLVRMAHAHTPFYRARLEEIGYDPGSPLTEEMWRQIPVLTRRDIQSKGELLKAKKVPERQQGAKEVTSSGSTGTPIRVFLPPFKGELWAAATLFEHVLHGRNFMQKAAAIRVRKNKDVGHEGKTSPDWGKPFTDVFETGPATLHDIHMDPEVHADWLMREDPAYLLIFPSNLEALLPILKDKGADLAGLEHFRTLSEQLPPTLREDVYRQFGKKIVDMYSAQEVGYIALQCPKHDHYHAFEDLCITEILHEDGTPCGPGEVGRVVVTDPFNLVFPLIRYDIGDYAEVGEPCDCGRTDTVIRQVMGRVRNLVTLPDGSRKWPMTASKKLREIGGVSQFQMIQTSIEAVRTVVVCQAPLSENQRARMIETVQDRLGHPFVVTIEEVEEIPRSANGKFEEFKSEVTPEMVQAVKVPSAPA